MLNYTKKVLFIGVLCSLASLNAYEYKFKNWIEKEIDFRFQLVAGIMEPIETVRIPAAKKDGTPGETSRNFTGGRIGLCMHTSNFSVRIMPSDDFRKPVRFGMGTLLSERRNMFEEARKKKFSDLRNWYDKELSCFNERLSRWTRDIQEYSECQNDVTTCGSTIEIGTTLDGYPIIWLSSGS